MINPSIVEKSCAGFHLPRWYDATTGRWITEDPVGLGPDSNPYRYCGNDPTNEIDPSGLAGLPAAGGGSASATGGVVLIPSSWLDDGVRPAPGGAQGPGVAGQAGAVPGLFPGDTIPVPANPSLVVIDLPEEQPAQQVASWIFNRSTYSNSAPATPPAEVPNHVRLEDMSIADQAAWNYLYGQHLRLLDLQGRGPGTARFNLDDSNQNARNIQFQIQQKSRGDNKRYWIDIGYEAGRGDATRKAKVVA